MMPTEQGWRRRYGKREYELRVANLDMEAATAEVRHLFGRLWFSDEAWTAFTRQIIDVAFGITEDTE